MALDPLLRSPHTAFLTATGAPLNGGKIFTYAAGTSTPQATFTDNTLTVPNANPVILDSTGYASIWLSPTIAYKIVAQNSIGVQQWSVDGVNDLGGASSLTTLANVWTMLQTFQAGIQVTGGETVDTVSASGNVTVGGALTTTGAVTGGTLASGSMVITGTGATSGMVLTASSPTASAFAAPVIGIEFIIDGGGAVPATGTKGYIEIPFACTITGWTLLADAVGSAVVDVKTSTYAGFPTTASIASTDKPTLVTVQNNRNLSLTVWTTAIAAGTIMEFNLVSVTTCQRITVALRLTRP